MPNFITKRPDWMRQALGLDPNYDVPKELADLVIPIVDIARVAVRPFAAEVTPGGPATTVIVAALPGRSIVLEFGKFENGQAGAGDFILQTTDGGAVIIEINRQTLAAGARAYLSAYVGQRLVLIPPGFNVQMQSTAVGAGANIFQLMGWSYVEITD